MRVVPRRKVLTSRDFPPDFLVEQPASTLGTVSLQPLRAGAAILRDLRLWHSGTPNFSKRTRFLPNVELISLQYAQFIDSPDHTFMQQWCSACSSNKCNIPEKEKAGSL